MGTDIIRSLPKLLVSFEFTANTSPLIYPFPPLVTVIVLATPAITPIFALASFPSPVNETNLTLLNVVVVFPNPVPSSVTIRVEPIPIEPTTETRSDLKYVLFC